MDIEQIQRLQEKQSQGHPMVETGMQFLSKFILSLDFGLSINLIENWLHDKSRSAYAESFLRRPKPLAKDSA